MKRLNLIAICLSLVFIISFSGCEPDMDLSNPKAITEGSFYKTTDDFQKALYAAYQQLVDFDGGYGRWMYYNLLGLEDGFTPTFKCQHPTIVTAVSASYYRPSSNGFGEIAAWMSMWRGVYACNIIIEKLEPITDETAIKKVDKDKILGQAYFLRGLYYLHLALLYGETIPLVDKVAETKDEMSPKNSEKGVIYPFIVNQFIKAKSLLPVRSSFYTADKINHGRATKGSAQGYLARTYLYRPLIDGGKDAEFDKAAKELQEIIQSGEYSLMSNYRDNFTESNENNKESLFEVQFYLTSPVAGQDINTISWRMQEVGIMDGTGGSWWNFAPNASSYNEFEVGDPRRYMTLWCPDGARFKDGKKMRTYTQMLKALTQDRDLYGCRKYCFDYTTPKIETGINDRLLRYSDILLMYAECLHETGHDGTDRFDISGAKYYIQEVRNRANNIVPSEDTTLWYSKNPGKLMNIDEIIGKDTLINGVKIQNIKDAIVHERFVELCGEYVRYFDLRRWAVKDDKYNQILMKKGLDRGQSNGFDPNKQGAFPIPQPELDNNKNLKGNDWN